MEAYSPLCNICANVKVFGSYLMDTTIMGLPTTTFTADQYRMQPYLTLFGNSCRERKIFFYSFQPAPAAPPLLATVTPRAQKGARSRRGLGMGAAARLAARLAATLRAGGHS